MPRDQKITVQNNFGKGLVTEATGLSFPENACTDTDNCVFSPFGVAARRLGFDYENSFDEYPQDISGKVIANYLWKNVASEGTLIFVVVQMGDFLHFYKVTGENSLSASKHQDIIDLTDFAPAGVTTVASLECQFSSGNGLLFVTNRRLDSFYVEYDIENDSFSATGIDIRIRDLEGDPADDLAIDFRPTSTVAGLDPEHFYNLKNQGWTDANLAAWDTARTDMPSNSDVSWYFKSSTNAFDFTTVNDRAVGNSPAPRGHYIYNLYDIDRQANGGATNSEIPLDRVTMSAFFAGRVFYSGLTAGNNSSRIFFTQIVERREQYGQCYQINDPTSEQLFDILPSDGGTIDILEAGQIIKMVPVLNTLLVFATNGIWAITGSQGIGFTATDYSINKVSSITNLSHNSFVDVEGTPFWWNLEGIYTISLDPQSNSMRAVSITDETIRQFFIDIPLSSKQYARGIYDQFTKQVQWIYRNEGPGNFNERYIYDRLLTYNLLSKAFFPWSVSSENVKIHGLTNVVGFGTTFDTVNVVNGADNVVDGGDQVIAFVSSNIDAPLSVIKYLVSSTTSEGSNDEFTKILLHMDGADASTTFTDSNSGGSAHTWTANGNAQIDTADFKFGGASGLFDGTGDYVTTPDTNADFDLLSNDFTIDTWFKANDDGLGITMLAGQVDSANSAASMSWQIFKFATKMRFSVIQPGGVGGTNLEGTSDFSNAVNTGWHHFAAVRTGDTIKMFIDGKLEAEGSFTGPVNNSPNNISVGRSGEWASLNWNGWIDEFRLSNGIARWTANFQVPSHEAIDEGTPILTYAENYKDTHLDWESSPIEGEEYDSFFVTGYAVRGQAIRKFQTNYVNLFSVNEVDSAFSIRGQWNYSVSPDSGKWSTRQNFTLLADHFQYKPKKIKIRGHGLACQFRVENYGNEPFNIIGWSTYETGNRGI